MQLDFLAFPDLSLHCVIEVPDKGFVGKTVVESAASNHKAQPGICVGEK